MKISGTILIILFACLISKSQAQTAVDFTQDDCNGEMHNLYADLDSGKIVVLEFVMDCQLCIDAGTAIQHMLTDLDQQYPGVFKVYQFAYSTLMNCDSMTAFKDTNSFTSYIFGENSHLMAHYGGFGMPTIGVAAGLSHTDIFSQVGFMISDTTQLGSVIRNYISTISVPELSPSGGIEIFPQPAYDGVNIICDKRIELIRLVNISGICVLEIPVNDIKAYINTFNISPGIYFIDISTGNKNYRNRIAVCPH
jgi:hypothetical protein